MTTKTLEPGDIKIVKIELRKLNGSTAVDIRSQLVSLSIYEDIDQPSMMAEATLIDSINLVQDFPIVGEEILNITYYTPEREIPTRLSFIVYRVESTGVAPSAKASLYTLKAVTPLHFFNSNITFEKTYNTTADEIVKDIVKNMAVNANTTVKLNAEKTKGLIPFAIPKLSPFQAVDLIKQRSISQEFPTGGVFVFFENQYGLQFRSIEGLLKEGKSQINSKVFTYASDTNSDNQRSQYAFRNILRYLHLNKFDTIEKAGGGALSSSAESFDILTKQTETVNFNLAEKMSLFTGTDEKGRLPNTNDFLRKNTNNNPLAGFFVPKDSSKGNDFIDVNIAIKNAFNTLLNQNTLRIMVHGDNYLSAGDLLKINLPEVSGTSDKKNNDRLNSGNYLVSKLRHIITMEEGAKPKHKITMDCVRMGYK